MLIILRPWTFLRVVATVSFADQHTVLLGDTLRPFCVLVLCVTIRVSGNIILGATLHVVFYFTLLFPVPWRVTATRS